jgi:hypothetical protein
MNGADTPDVLRLSMVPGMFHCPGGIGTDRLDAMTALVDWVERGEPPALLMASALRRVASCAPGRYVPMHGLGSRSTD